MDSTESIHGVEINESLRGKWVRFSNYVLKNYTGYVALKNPQSSAYNILYNVSDKLLSTTNWSLKSVRGSGIVTGHYYRDEIHKTSFNAHWYFWDNGNKADMRHTIIHSIIE